jgi:hypothetical protein
MRAGLVLVKSDSGPAVPALIYDCSPSWPVTRLSRRRRPLASRVVRYAGCGSRARPRLLPGGKFGEFAGDDGVAASSRMLVAQGGTSGGVAKTRHELGESGTGRRCQYSAGVPQIVPPQIGPAGDLPSMVKTPSRSFRGARSAVQRGWRQVGYTIRSREE